MSRRLAGRQVEAVPEDAAAVAAFDRALERNRSQVLERLAGFHEGWAQQRVTTLRNIGWPLRPLFIRRELLDFTARAIHRNFQRLTRKLLPLADSPEKLARKVPIDARVYRALDVKASLQSELFLELLRPDGFLFPDRYVLSELNFGNGSIVSNAYTEVLFDYYRTCPAMRAAGTDVERQLPRPFQAYAQLIRRLIPPEVKKPFVALLAHSHEHSVILSWEERVIQQVYFAQRMLEAAGLPNRLVHETDVRVDREGQARLRTGRKVDAVVQITIGSSFMDEPWRLAPGGDLSALRGPRVGNAPLLKPVVSVCMDKGTMPFFGQLPSWPARHRSGFEVVQAPTEYPEREHAAHYRLHKDDYVLKRSFDGKDTHVGRATHGRVWNTVLEQALGSWDYVLQRYQSLPRTVMPVALDERTIEWVPVRVELSPFIIGGRYAGAIARYAPDAEGLVLSPPPPDMGLTTVYPVEA
jgi:hypothetical protein